MQPESQLPDDVICMPLGMLSVVWPEIERLLKIVARKGRSDWTPDEVRSLLEAGEYDLFLWVEESKIRGFAIGRVEHQFKKSIPTFFVWIAFLYRGQNVIHAQNRLESVARLTGAERITFYSPREGFKRRFEVQQYIYQWSLANVEH